MNRREFVLGAAALAALGTSLAPAPSVSREKVRVVIAGAGAAGLTIASQLRMRLPNATITIFDARKQHYFQPGYTLVGAGWWSPSEVIDTTRQYITPRRQLGL